MQAVHRVPVEALSGAPAIVQPEPEQGQNGVVDAIRVNVLVHAAGLLGIVPGCPILLPPAEIGCRWRWHDEASRTEFGSVLTRPTSPL
jgi:hypothetical protein